MNTSSFLSGGISHSMSTDTNYYSVSIDTINSVLNSSGIPTNAEITNISINVNVSFTFHGWVGTMRAYYAYGFGNNGSISTHLKSSTAIHDGSTGDKSNSKSSSTNINSYMSSKLSPFALGKAYGSYFTVSLQSDNVLSKTINVDSVTLTVDYKIPTYTVSLACDNGGKELVGAGTYSRGTVINIACTNQTGYRFTQWSDGNTTNPRSITVNSDINLTAYHNPITYYVSYGGATGNGWETMATDTVKYDEDYYIKQCSFTHIPHTIKLYRITDYVEMTKDVAFDYWEDFSQNKYYAGEKKKNLRDTPEASIGLTACWKAPTFTLPEPEPLSGHKFTGWIYFQDGNELKCQAGDKITTMDIDAFFAEWEKVKLENVYGGNKKTTVYVGNAEVKAVYVGNTQIYG